MIYVVHLWGWAWAWDWGHIYKYLPRQPENYKFYIAEERKQR